MEMKSNPKYLIHSVEKACDVLESFTEDINEIGVTELGKKLGLTKSTVHKILLTLQYKGFVEQNEENGKYHLSVKLYEIACNYLNKINVNSVIRPIMEQLSEKFNETVHFAVLDEDEVVYVEKIEGKQSINIYSRIGRRSPLHCPSVGKSILANLDDKEIMQIIKRKGLKKYTDHTIVDENSLFKEIERIRKCGYAIDNEEYEKGIKCVGIPIKNLAGKLIGAMSVSGLASRMTEEKINEIITALLEISKEIPSKLGYS